MLDDEEDTAVIDLCLDDDGSFDEKPMTAKRSNDENATLKAENRRPVPSTSSGAVAKTFEKRRPPPPTKSKPIMAISLISDSEDSGGESERQCRDVPGKSDTWLSATALTAANSEGSQLLEDGGHLAKTQQSVSSSQQSRFADLLDTGIFDDDDASDGGIGHFGVRPHFEFSGRHAQVDTTKTTARITARNFSVADLMSDDMNDTDSSSAQVKKRTGKRSTTAVSQEERLAKKLEKQREKELLKAEKQKETTFKKALIQANKVMADKRVVVYEVVVELDRRILELTSCEGLLEELRDKSIKFNIVDQPVPYTATWKRVVPKRWDQEAGAFVPLEREHTFDENFVLYMPTIDFFTCDMIAKNQMENTVNQLRRVFGRKKILILIDGLEHYYQKRKRQANQSFKEQLRGSFRKSGSSSGASIASSSSQSSSTVTLADINQNLPDKQAIDEAMLWLQMEADCCVISVNKRESCTDWIVTYSREIAVGPYEKGKTATNLGFSVEDIGPAGKNQKDTWSRMLQILDRVTPDISELITAQYPTVSSLWKDYQRLGPAASSSLLQDLMLERHATGTVRRIGPSISSRVHQNLTATDPNLPFC